MCVIKARMHERVRMTVKRTRLVLLDCRAIQQHSLVRSTVILHTPMRSRYIIGWSVLFYHSRWTTSHITTVWEVHFSDFFYYNTQTYKEVSLYQWNLFKKTTSQSGLKCEVVSQEHRLPGMMTSGKPILCATAAVPARRWGYSFCTWWKDTQDSLGRTGISNYNQWPLLLTWFNFNPSMDK